MCNMHRRLKNEQHPAGEADKSNEKAGETLYGVPPALLFVDGRYSGSGSWERRWE